MFVLIVQFHLDFLSFFLSFLLGFTICSSSLSTSSNSEESPAAFSSTISASLSALPWPLSALRLSALISSVLCALKCYLIFRSSSVSQMVTSPDDPPVASTHGMSLYICTEKSDPCLVFLCETKDGLSTPFLVAEMSQTLQRLSAPTVANMLPK